METRTNRIWLVMMVLLLGLVGASWAEDPNLGTVFSYQGRLETAGSGDPLSGSYDFKFRVYADAVSTNTAIGDPMEVPNVPVTKGIFTVQLDPDPNGTAPNLFNGEVRYLEIAVRGKDDPNYFTINPRQRINAAPYAITASSARWLRGRTSTEKVVYVDDVGNVGIGTTNPTAKLEVNGNIKTAGVYEDSSGNVGIGTTDPGANRLKVVGNMSVQGKADINDWHERYLSSTKGYAKMGNILIQWGTVDNADPLTEYQFRTSFPHACFSVVINRKVSGGSCPVYTHTWDTESFWVNRNDSIDGWEEINYIAIGY